jgi:hypothetical protein
MKNKLTDLNDHLFAQIERLGDPDLSAEALEREVKRTAAVVQVADKIVDNARLQLAACKMIAENGDAFTKRLPMLAPVALERVG